MGGRGIDLVVLKNGEKEQVFKRLSITRPWKDTWTDCLSIDKRQDGTMTPFWEKITEDVSPRSIIEIFLKSDKHLVREIVAFRANGNLVWLKDIYPYFKNPSFYCFFKTNKKNLLLYQVGCKSIKEALSVGGNNYSSNLPMTIVLSGEEKEKTFSIPNL